MRKSSVYFSPPPLSASAPSLSLLWRRLCYLYVVAWGEIALISYWIQSLVAYVTTVIVIHIL